MPRKPIDKAISAMRAAERLRLEMQELMELKKYLQEMEEAAAARRSKKPQRKQIKRKTSRR
jgi:hypothetical protein